MISGVSNGALPQLRPASTSTSSATSGLQPVVPDASDAATGGFRIDVSQVKPLTGAKPISAADDPFLRDLMATHWLISHETSAPESSVPDNAPENVYAQVKVDGKVVATLYNAGSSAMTNQAAAKIGKLEDPPGLSGPDLAQWRADQYAERLGGTVEKAPTAITQSQWTPRESKSTTYSREQLDAAFQAMLAEGQKATAQQQSSYAASRAQAGTSADFSA
ncbi:MULTISPECIES: hypothetical protein [Bradyrhizobium]|jgi:hypothetical protein|uniref:Uncharacterized protein n=1 Tax=Bradyrhizobium arachidis TaxID=858423 RepID=A0AAE7TM34_9BRAD|nr:MULTISPECIES: hypothetical protein [Bradyrhizobium]QOG16284.1 hypothetical protein FOM02_01890 [Bradyrhizobium sp. SEMIA]QOZ72999.1 hypothetical protein WN72_47055 [Bradyrhizobium arachidis]UFW49460.1 hypothetical protein BaraCB756_45865 [Bradyrhizobium arachidis]SFU34358.1 hypothetical protein SAMN05192541_101401 [Bradyrhizobium arachidis]